MKRSLFLGCDWGTSSFRLSLADQSTGRSLCEVRDDDGIQPLHRRLSGVENHETRTREMRRILRQKRDQLAVQARQELTELPIVLSGMASSNIGLLELPYANLPIDIEQPNFVTRTIEPDRTLSNRLLLVSGVRDRQDVMRGEEVQLLGLSSKHTLNKHTCIFPGTHSKHLTVQDGKLISFRSYLTGELFNAILLNTLLKDAVQPADLSFDEGEAAFRQGVIEAVHSNILHSLFAIRAEQLLAGTDPHLAYLRLSGILIGTELKELQLSSDTLLLASSGPLDTLYALALKSLDLSFIHEVETDRLTLLGQAACLRIVL